MSVLSARPRLEPSVDGIGPGPLSPVWQEPEWADDGPWASLDAGVHTATPVLETLLRQLDYLRAECLAAVREREAFPVAPIGRADLDALNRILAGIKILNAALSHVSRSREVADWPDPVLPATVILGPRDLIRVLQQASNVVQYTISQRKSWYHTHG
jgi:hypothetical protein